MNDAQNTKIIADAINEILCGEFKSRTAQTQCAKIFNEHFSSICHTFSSSVKRFKSDGCDIELEVIKVDDWLLRYIATISKTDYDGELAVAHIFLYGKSVDMVMDDISAARRLKIASTLMN